MIKVGHVTTVDLSLRFLLLNQLRSLKQAGYSITGISATGPHVAVLQEQDIRHIPVTMTRSITPLADLSALWRLYRVMRRERFTIVHCHTPKAELLGQLAARLAGVPVVVDTFRGIYDRAGTGRIRRWVLVTMSRIAASCADLVLCQSREAMAAMVREKFCEPDRIALLGNGVDIRHFDRDRLDPADREAVRKALGLDSARPVIGFVGRLVREKGILDLFQAMCLVRAHVPNAQLVVVGPADGDKPDAVTPEQARRYGLEQGCVFTGLRTDMPLLYSLMDVFVLPSSREGLPRSPMEASAMGVPCVLTDIPGCREVVEHGRNGLLVPVGSPSALAGAIVTLLTHKDLAERMGHAGREKAVDCFDEERVFATVKSAYARLLMEKGIESGGQRVRRLDRTSQAIARQPPVKRLLDLFIAAAALAVLSPLMLLVAIVVRCTMGAPVVFRQRRPGLNGRPFVIFKFRTMREIDDAAPASADNDRLAATGRLLRALSLDELPQLINVLKGDMSLVGPRPLLMQYLDRYTPAQARRHEVKPGVTGWAQVNGRNALSWEERLAMDVWYVDHQSLWLDLRILARTMTSIVRRRGVNAPGEATMHEFLGSER